MTQGLQGQDISSMSDQYNPKLPEVYTDVPVITPGTNDQAPSDAIVLFNGRDIDEWVSDKGKRDSGILYYSDEHENDKVWPTSIECQIQEGDCGDFWCVGTMVEPATMFETALFFYSLPDNS
jgi:hypothetical protein